MKHVYIKSIKAIDPDSPDYMLSGAVRVTLSNGMILGGIRQVQTYPGDSIRMTYTAIIIATGDLEK